ncbi:beta-galactosidase [bacterium]|nr:beta-galactosidase [bacterium]
MPDRYPPINPKCPHMLHGGDYNPDQWIETPEIWDEDMRLMRLAHCNAMTVGVFSWAQLEPEEGHYDFSWLDTIMDKLAENDAFAVLATPSAARPAWLSKKNPEILRVQPDRHKIRHGGRCNHCPTSPIYREKTQSINRALAERYRDHPALLVWHLSNEYSGECHCDLCQEAFRAWLRERYEHDLARLNHAWWTRFWSHAFTDWSQIESPGPNGENSIHGLNLDWKRFVTHQTVDFMKNEMVPLREFTPDVPVTTNFIGAEVFVGRDYWKFRDVLDVVSVDLYPHWGREEESVPDWQTALQFGFVYDMHRAMLDGKPFMLMESSPGAAFSTANSRLKRPGMHRLASLQAVAHGSDTVQYFQWRKSRGGAEKFHGAVVDHAGHENTRVFQDVAALGETLRRLDDVVGARTNAEVAVIYDWENRWAIDDVHGLRREHKDYFETCVRHYGAFWKQGVAVDVINEDADFSKYKILVAPMLYMVRPGVAERIESFVRDGGTFVATYWSGIVDESDLCFLGGFPGPLRRVLGVWAEEIDALGKDERKRVTPLPGNALGLTGTFEAVELCDLIHAESAETVAIYASDFYESHPALTRNTFGEGEAWYIAFRDRDPFLDPFYEALIKRAGIRRTLEKSLPLGVSVRVRGNGRHRFYFLLNFTDLPRNLPLGSTRLADVENGMVFETEMVLEPRAALVAVEWESRTEADPFHLGGGAKARWWDRESEGRAR